MTVFKKAEPKGADTNKKAATDNIFIVNEDCEKHAVNKAVEFHNLVARVLYNTACHAVHLQCYSLMKILCSPNNYNWTKLFHWMQYLRGICSLQLTLSVKGGGIIKRRIDLSFVEYLSTFEDMPDQECPWLNVFTNVNSIKQKLNSHSFEDSEIVGSDDLCHHIVGHSI